MRGVLQEGDEDRAGDVAGFRQYNEAPARVIEFYCRQHTELTYARVRSELRFVSAPARVLALRAAAHLRRHIDPTIRTSRQAGRHLADRARVPGRRGRARAGLPLRVRGARHGARPGQGGGRSARHRHDVPRGRHVPARVSVRDGTHHVRRVSLKQRGRQEPALQQRARRVPEGLRLRACCSRGTTS